MKSVVFEGLEKSFLLESFQKVSDCETLCGWLLPAEELLTELCSTHLTGLGASPDTHTQSQGWW